MSDEGDYFRNRNVGKVFHLVLQISTELHVVTQRLHARPWTTGVRRWSPA